MFKLVSDFKTIGDQLQAIDCLVKGINEGKKFQTLLGGTGSGKTLNVEKYSYERIRKKGCILTKNMVKYIMTTRR